MLPPEPDEELPELPLPLELELLPELPLVVELVLVLPVAEELVPELAVLLVLVEELPEVSVLVDDPPVEELPDEPESGLTPLGVYTAMVWISSVTFV